MGEVMTSRPGLLVRDNGIILLFCCVDAQVDDVVAVLPLRAGQLAGVACLVSTDIKKSERRGATGATARARTTATTKQHSICSVQSQRLGELWSTTDR
eukprot:scaffold21332_cov66-Cyclotella_meneghiniana.AAC.2